MNKYLFPFFVLFSIVGSAQNDTIKLKNNDLIVGEIKYLTKGIVTVETTYSDKDFRIEFNKVKGLIMKRKCLIELTDGRLRFGNIRTEGDSQVVITLENGEEERYALYEVTGLVEVDDNFWQRFKVAIDLGFNLTKANNSSQLNVSGDLDYYGEILLMEGSVNLLNASQDDVADTKRTDANLKFLRLLPKKWYLLGDISFLSNTEQALDARISTSVGPGKLLVSTNKLYLAAAVGIGYNIENYTDTSLNKTSFEVFFATTFNMFDFEDIDLDTGFKVYPSLSESGRVRIDYDFDFKYDLPLEFYLKFGFTLNFDNEPAILGNDVDYIFTSGFGWEFD